MTDINLVGEFLFGLLPENVGKAYRFLAALKYPIPDMKSFKAQVVDAIGDDPRQGIILEIFEPEDFGLDTAQSAFEKFRKRSRHLDLPGIPLSRENLQVLSDAVVNGALRVAGENLIIVAKDNDPGGPQVSCSCEPDLSDPDGTLNPYATCGNPVVENGRLRCRGGDCKGTCYYITKVPVPKFAFARL